MVLEGSDLSFKDKVVVWDSRKVAWGWQAKLPSDKNWRLGALRNSRLPSPSPKRTSRSRHCLSFFHQCRCSPTVITCLCSLSPETCLAPLVQHVLSTTFSCSFIILYRPSILLILNRLASTLTFVMAAEGSKASPEVWLLQLTDDGAPDVPSGYIYMPPPTDPAYILRFEIEGTSSICRQGSLWVNIPASGEPFRRGQYRRYE